MPSASRQPIIIELVSATSANAPSSGRIASTKRSTIELLVEVARRWRITSVSEVDWKIEPVSRSACFSLCALVMLPLWATAKPPTAVSAKSGCTLWSAGSPVVE